MEDCGGEGDFSFFKKAFFAGFFSNKNIIFGVAVLATFFLIWRDGQFIKLSDFLFVLAGVLVFVGGNFKVLVGEFWPRARSFVFVLAFLVLFVLVGQLGGYFFYDSALTSTREAVVGYGRMFLDIGVFTLSAFLVFRDSRLFRALSLTIFISALVVIPTFFGVWSDETMSAGRLAGFLQDPIIFGSYLVVIFLVGLGLFFYSSRSWQKLVVVLGLTVIAGFILWSASRAAWVSLGVALAVWVLFYFRGGSLTKAWKIIVITPVTFFFGYFLLGLSLPASYSVQSLVLSRAGRFVANPFSDQVRHKFWLEASRLVADNPFGFGLGSYAGGGLIGGTFNTFLEIAVYGGVAALAIFILILFWLGSSARSAVYGFRLFKPKDLDLRLAWFAAVIAMAVDIFFAEAFFWRHIWFVLGVALGVSWQRSGEESDAGQNS